MHESDAALLCFVCKVFDVQKWQDDVLGPLAGMSMMRTGPEKKKQFKCIEQRNREYPHKESRLVDLSCVLPLPPADAKPRYL